MDDPNSMGGEFCFEVRARNLTWDPGTEFVVQLPHSCEEWVIADAPTREQAVAAMETFVAEAQAALERLKTVDVA